MAVFNKRLTQSDLEKYLRIVGFIRLPSRTPWKRQVEWTAAISLVKQQAPALTLDKAFGLWPLLLRVHSVA
jgi:hypothetical protein